MATEITTSLMNISMMMNDGCDFIRIRFKAEQWEIEAAEGNDSSQQLINIIKQFERLMRIAKR